MITPENAAITIEVIKEIASDPQAGVIRDLITQLESLVSPVKEVRVVTGKETR